MFGLVVTAMLVSSCGPKLLRSNYGLLGQQCEKAPLVSVCAFTLFEGLTKEQIKLIWRVPPSVTTSNQQVTYAIEAKLDSASSWRPWTAVTCQAGFSTCNSSSGSVDVTENPDGTKILTLTHSLFTTFSGYGLQIRGESDEQNGDWFKLIFN